MNNNFTIVQPIHVLATKSRNEQLHVLQQVDAWDVPEQAKWKQQFCQNYTHKKKEICELNNFDW